MTHGFGKASDRDEDARLTRSLVVVVVIDALTFRELMLLHLFVTDSSSNVRFFAQSQHASWYLGQHSVHFRFTACHSKCSEMVPLRPQCEIQWSLLNSEELSAGHEDDGATKISATGAYSQQD
ncbi:hypothetical protein DFH06DRAFT_1152973 [Mycena polygramma]|nr:hypothetical protein DFH06DRAFT_1152973 [Mycena polygramma]